MGPGPAPAAALAVGTVTFRCAATGVVVYPRGAMEALSRFRRAVRHRDCPGCDQSAHASWWRIEVRGLGRTRWLWEELTVRREAVG